MHANTVHQRILASWHPGHLHANPSCTSAAQIYLTWQKGCSAPVSALPDQPCVVPAPTDEMKVMFLTARVGRWASPAGMQDLRRVWEMEALS